MTIAVPMSGGFDSFYTAWRLVKTLSREELKEYTFYSVDYPRPYRKVERRALEKISKKLRIKIKEVKTDMLYDKSTLKHGGHIINMRNLVILALGSQIPNLTSIVMDVAKEDYSTWVADKNPKFINQLNALFATSGIKPLTVCVGHDKTKTHALRYIRAVEGDAYGKWVMENTVSCHGKDEQVPCGNCSSCLWKWVMMTNNGLDTKRYFDEWNSDHKVLHKSKIKKILDRHLESGDHWIDQIIINNSSNVRLEDNKELLAHIVSWRHHTQDLIDASLYSHGE